MSATKLTRIPTPPNTPKEIVASIVRLKLLLLLPPLSSEEEGEEEGGCCVLGIGQGKGLGCEGDAIGTGGGEDDDDSGVMAAAGGP
jgi:hypothetical protein